MREGFLLPHHSLMHLTSGQEAEASPRAGKHRGDCGHRSPGVTAVTPAGTASGLKNCSPSLHPQQGSPDFPFKEEQQPRDAILDSGMLAARCAVCGFPDISLKEGGMFFLVLSSFHG